MKLLSIVGARPQFVKLAPLAQAIDRHNAALPGGRIQHLILHTGQHYDPSMSDVFFTELALPRSNFDLGVGSGSHGRQTGAMLAGIEEVLEKETPDLMVVYGDTNSTVAGALAAAKLHVPVAHVEAGLRSFNRRMPEEINRVVADHVCGILLAPTPTAMAHLAQEGLASKSVLTGDLMHDTVLHYRRIASETSTILARLDLARGAYGVVTLHRAENTDDPVRLRALLDALEAIAAQGLRLVFPMHPRTRARLSAQRPDWHPSAGLLVVEPVGYLDSLQLLANARIALTDSGGLQKEALFCGCPCVTLRTETEWVETLEVGANILADADPNRIAQAVAHFGRLYPRGGADFRAAATRAFGAGDAAEHILRAAIRFQTLGRVVPDLGTPTGGKGL